MDELRELLVDVDWRVRKHAIETVVSLLPLNTDELTRLQLIVAGLRADTYWQVREAVASTLACLGCSKASMEALSQMVGDWRPEVVQAAIGSLIALDCKSPEAAEAAAAASTEHLEHAVHTAAFEVFPTIARAGGGYRLSVGIARRLAHDQAEVRSRAVDALRSLACQESVSRAIGEQLVRMEGNGHSRVSALLALKLAGRCDQGAANALLLALQDTDSRVRKAAADATVHLTCDTEPKHSTRRAVVIDGLIDLLRHDHPEVRAIAVTTLEQAAPIGHERAGAALAQSLEDLDTKVHHQAAHALKSLVTADDSQAVVSMASRVGHHDEHVRELACEALHCVIGEHDEYAAGLISQHLSSSNPEVRKSASQELGLQLYNDVVPVWQLLDFLKHEDEGVRADVVHVLANLAPTQVRQGIGNLTDVHSVSSIAHEREAAVQALGFMADPHDVAVRGCLVARLDDKSHSVRMAAVQSISRLYNNDAAADASQKTVGAIVERLPSRTGEVRTAMLQALRHIAEHGDEAVALACATSLDDANEHVRQTAVEVLEHMYAGCSSVTVKAAVAKRLNHTEHCMRTSAKHALLAIARCASGDKDSITLIAEVLTHSETWGIRRSAADALLGIAGEAEKNIASSISSLVAIHDEQVWWQHLKGLLLSLAPKSPPPSVAPSPKFSSGADWLTLTAALADLRYPKFSDLP